MNAQLGPVTGRASAQIRNNSAVQNLMAAAEFARVAYQIECNNAGQEWNEKAEPILWYVSSCVIMAVAAVEAHFNELLEDMDVDETFIGLIERRSMREKLNHLVWFNKFPALAWGAGSPQHFLRLLELRNALVHARPEWDHEASISKTLEKRLNKLFPLSPFFPETHPFFTHRCMSHGCAKWAVQTARQFGNHYSDALGRPRRFDKHAAKYTTEA